MYAKSNHPIIKHNPPMGVIAPIHFKSVKTRIIRLPEKINIPEIKKYAGKTIKFSGK